MVNLLQPQPVSLSHKGHRYFGLMEIQGRATDLVHAEVAGELRRKGVTASVVKVHRACALTAGQRHSGIESSGCRTRANVQSAVRAPIVADDECATRAQCATTEVRNVDEKLLQRMKQGVRIEKMMNQD